MIMPYLENKSILHLPFLESLWVVQSMVLFRPFHQWKDTNSCWNWSGLHKTGFIFKTRFKLSIQTLFYVQLYRKWVMRVWCCYNVYQNRRPSLFAVLLPVLPYLCSKPGLVIRGFVIHIQKIFGTYIRIYVYTDIPFEFFLLMHFFMSHLSNNIATCLLIHTFNTVIFTRL